MLTQPRLCLNTDFKSYMRIAQGQLSLSPKNSVEQLEGSLKDYFQTPNTLALNQGRIGMYLAIRALVEEGKNEVVMSPYTLFEVINMVIYAGGKPVFSDTIKDSPFVSEDKIASLITPKTIAVIVTHYHQTTPQLLEIKNLCDTRGVKLIEDCAIAYGTQFKGKKVGMHGHMGIFSYGLFKNVAAFYGGCLVARDQAYFDKVCELHKEFVIGSKSRLFKRAVYGLALDSLTNPLIFSALTFPLIRKGHNTNNDMITKFTRADAHPTIQPKYPDMLASKMRPEQAQVVLDKLPMVEENRQIRIEKAMIYHEALKGIDGIVLPDPVFDGSSAWLEYPVIFRKREKMYDHFLNRRRDIRFFYYRNCSDLPIYSDCENTDCPNALDVQNQTLMMPIYPSYSYKQIQLNIDAIKEFFSA